MKRYLAFASIVCLLSFCGLLIAQPTTEPSETSGLKITKVTEPTGAKAGDTVRVLYVGTFVNGQEFDSAKDEPIEFQLGATPPKVIKGWEQGLLGMQVGEKRRLSIPADLAYGPNGRGKIPPNTPLEFDITMVGLIRQ